MEGVSGAATDIQTFRRKSEGLEKIKHTCKSQVMASRSYGQYCGLARSLDTIGDRWSLLIVRELLLGPLRYNQLKTVLDGIATNLLADQLRDLERSEERRGGTAGGA